MAKNAKHGGGPVIAPVIVDTSGNTLVLPDQQIPQGPAGYRGYAIIRAAVTNSTVNPVFIHMEDLTAAPSPKLVAGTGGIPLYPGDAYEISEINLYMGPIYAVIAAGTGILHVEVGR